MAKVKIGDFLFERKGRYKPSDISIQGLKRIEKIDFNGNFHIGNKSSKTNMILVKKGDLVISGINVAKGAMGIYNGEEDVVATIHYSSFTFDKSKINVDYFKHFLKSPKFIELLKNQIKGGIKTEIKAKHLLPLEIDLPDIEKQNEIVLKFEAVENDIECLRQEIKIQRKLLKKLRQSILQEAIEGKLSAEWRAEHPDVESASVLLEKIRAEKERLVKEKKIKKQKPLPPIGDEEKPFEIPETWVWCRLGDYSINKDENRIPVSKADREKREKIYDYYGASGVIDKIDGYTHEGTFLLIGEDGANLVTRNIPVAFIASGKFWVNNHAHILEFLDLNSLKYIEKYINAIDLKPYITGGFQPKLSQANLSKIKVAIPPIEEQKEIVKKIESLFKICDALEEQIEQSKADSEMLMQAILREAFEG